MSYRDKHRKARCDRCGRWQTDVVFCTLGAEPSTTIDIICDDCAPEVFEPEQKDRAQYQKEEIENG